MGVIWLGGIALCAGQLRGFLTRPRVKASLEGISGLAMIGFGARLAFSRAR
jgi:threonine/homoserine/homoserine lactone efflux protein